MSSKTEEARVEVILNGQKANATLNEMRAAARALNAELGKIPDPLNSSEFAAGHKKLDDLKGKIGEVSGKAKESGDSFKGMVKDVLGITLGYAALAAAGKEVIQFFKDGVKEAIEEERANTKLLFALKGNNDAFQRMTKFRKELVETTLFSKDEINRAISFGLELDKTESQTRKMITAAMGLSRVVPGADLDSAMKMLVGTYNGVTKGINRYVEGVVGLTDQQYAAGVAIDIVAEKLGKFATEGLDTTGGKLIQAGKAWKEFGESLANVFLPIIGQVADGINELLGSKDAEIRNLTTHINNLKNANVSQGFMGFGTVIYAGASKELELEQIRLKIMLQDKMFGQQKDNIEVKKAENEAILKGIDLNDKDWKSKLKAQLPNQYLLDLDKKQENADLTKTWNEQERIAKEYAKKLLDIRKKLEDATIQLIQDERDKELKMAELDLVRDLNEIKGSTTKENQLSVDLLNAAIKKKKEINAKYDLKKIQDALKTEKEKWEAIIKADKEGSAEWMIDSMQLLEKMQEIELNNVNLTEKQKLDIKEKYLQLGKALETKFISGNDKPDTEYKAPTGTMSSRSGADKLGTFDLDKKKALLTAQANAEVALVLNKEKANVLSAKQSADAQKAIWKNFYASLSDERMKEIESLAALANEAINVLSTVFTAQNAYEDRALQKDDEANKKKKDNLKTQLDNKQISQKQYDAAILKMDNEADAKHKEIAHKQAVRQKEIAVFNATIALLQAIIQAANIAPPADIIFPIIIAALMGIQLAALIATPVPAAAKGRYDVIGQDDGKAYSADWGGKAKTGIYSQPTLVAEAGPELIVDAATTKNLQMNFPWVLGAINNARVPQYAAGSYPGSGGSGGQPIIITQSNPRLEQLLERLDDRVREPLNARISYEHLMEEIAKVDQIKRDASKN